MNVNLFSYRTGKTVAWFKIQKVPCSSLPPTHFPATWFFSPEVKQHYMFLRSPSGDMLYTEKLYIFLSCAWFVCFFNPHEW